MGELKDKFELLTIIIGLISSIIAVANCIYKNFNTIFYISMFFVGAMGIVFCFFAIKKYPVLKRYKFIKYLFFEIRENKFNVVPKILLFLDLKKKRNRFVIREMCITYTLKENNGKIDSYIKWSLEDISNVTSKDFYFYTGIDLGKIQNQNFIIYTNNNSETVNLLQDNINRKNGVFLCHWDIPPHTIKDGKKIDKIELTMDQKDSFDFSNKEVIYFFPWNFGKKIEKVKFEITYTKSLGKISMQLFEAGKIRGKKFPFHYSLETTVDEKFSENNDTYIYEFCLEKDNLKIENLYYFLLYKI